MILSRKTFLAFLFFATTILVNSQELIYTVIGEFNSSSFSLDSIMVENISNGTQLVFGDLPIQTDYKINLSTGELMGPTGIDMYQIANYISVIRNISGNICISVRSNMLQHVRAFVYNIHGQMLCESGELNMRSGDVIDVHLPGGDIYIVEVATEYGSKAFKAIGSLSKGAIQIMKNGDPNSGDGRLKNTPEFNYADFSFQAGDSIRISVFRDGYYSRPAGLKIISSESLLFSFEISNVDINGISDVYSIVNDSLFSSIDYSILTGEAYLTPKSEDKNIEVGDIITIDVDTAGYLRKVVSITTHDGEIILQTEQATMNELFVEKAFKLNTSMIEPSTSLKSTNTMMEISEALTDEEGYIHPVEVIYFNSEGETYRKSTVNLKSSSDEIRQPIIHEFMDFSMTDLYGESGDNIHFYISEGNISFNTDAVFEFDFTYEGAFSEDTKVKKGDLNVFEFYLEATSGILTKVELDMSNEWNKKEKHKLLLNLARAQAQFMVPPGIPVWIDFDVNMYRTIDLHADADFHADWGFEVSDTLKVGGRYTRETKELTPISEFNHHDEIYPLNLEGEINASARLELFPRVDMKLYSIFGPFAEIVPYVQGNFNGALQAQITPTGSETFLAFNAGLDLGLDLRVGTELDVLFYAKEFGPKVSNCLYNPIWRSPYNIELLTDLPEEVELGSTLTLEYKVTDNIGLPENLIPVYIEGDGTFNKHIVFTDQSGNLSVDWTIDGSEGDFSVSATIFNADKTVIDVATATLSAVDVILFNPSLTYGTLTDIDGNNYKTIQIGNQVWMAENLKTTHYADGSAIPLVEDSPTWAAFEADDGAYCWYDNNIANKNTYGGLYTWAAAMKVDGANPIDEQGVCPNGWHVPSELEWQELEMQLGMSQAEAGTYNWRGTDEGLKLKETGLNHWLSPNEGATNSSGFTALPGGFRHYFSPFQSKYEVATYWTATEYDVQGYAWLRTLNYTAPGIYRGSDLKQNGLSVRCVEDTEAVAPIADFTTSTSEITEGESVQFTDQSTNEPTEWSWSFGDGGTSSEQNPSHIYATAGLYSVTLSVTNSADSDTEIKTDYITVLEAGNGIIFNPDLTYGTVTDIDGNVYRTIQIGDQVWMAENLRAIRFNDETIINPIVANLDWANAIIPGYSWYDNNETEYKNKFGTLYNWYVVETNNICPTGWHVPTDNEWMILESLLGMSEFLLDNTGWRGGDVATKLKAISGWNSNGNGTNESGYTALPGGIRLGNGVFTYFGNAAAWWTSSQGAVGEAWFRQISYQDGAVNRFDTDIEKGYSIRCVED